MAASRKRRLERTGLDFIEESARLLRSAPAGVLLRYYIGSVPCILGLLYFFTDVTRGAYASKHLIESSLGAAALYLWMKCWHTAFNSGLRSVLAQEPPEPWTLRRIMRLIVLQVAVQPSGLFLRIVAAICLLPYVWVYGFYQGFGVFGDGLSPSISEVARRAWEQAKWQPGHAHVAIACLKAFAFVVWLNVLVFLFMAPELLRIFTGIETVFTRSPMAMLNTTFFIASLAITYLCFDPLRKALYVLRCFYSDAVRTGQDLEVELKSLHVPAARFAAAALLLLSTAPLTPRAFAAEPPPAVERVDSTKLSDSIEDVLRRREYTWRLPREKTPEEEKGLLTQFIERLIETIRWAIKSALKWISDLLEKMSPRGGSGDGAGFSWTTRGILYATIALCIGLILFFLWKQRRNLRVTMVAAEAMSAIPDLRSDDVVADQLPEDGWLKLARDLMDQGELRLALRASYLASLAHLGRRELISIARHKSNLDYERELRRRARSREELLSAFDANLDAFECAWYGLHEVTADILTGFNANLDRIRAC
jgi:hypothetical protein